MTISLVFAWCHFWVGAYWDHSTRRLFILPVPCFGIVLEFEKPITAELIEIPEARQ